MRTRCYRRSQKRRAMRRARRFLQLVGDPPSARQVHMYAENRVPCSCHVCRDEKYYRPSDGWKEVRSA